MRVYQSIARLHRALFRDADRRLTAAVGLTSAQMTALFVLERQDGCPLGQLADALSINASAATATLERLERAGLARRRPGTADRRVVCAWLTDAGRQLARRAKPLVQRRNRDLLAGFDAAEIAVIQRFVETVIARTADVADDRAA